MSSQTPMGDPPTHTLGHSALSHHSRMLPLNPKTGRYPTRRNLVPSMPTISGRSISYGIFSRISPFPLHRPLQIPPPLSPPIHQVHPVGGAFLQSTSPRAATFGTLLSRTRTISSRKSPLRLTTFDGDLVAIMCHRRPGACALFILILHLVHLTLACLVPRVSRSDVLPPIAPRQDADFRDH